MYSTLVNKSIKLRDLSMLYTTRLNYRVKSTSTDSITIQQSLHRHTFSI